MLSFVIENYQSKHAGDLLAVINLSDYETFCRDNNYDPDYDEVFVRLKSHNNFAYAQLHGSGNLDNGKVGLSEILLHNLSAKVNEQVHLELWIPSIQTKPATYIELDELNKLTLGYDTELDDLHQRLEDAQITLVKNQRFSVNLNGKELVFDILNLNPNNAPAHCNAETRIEVVNWPIAQRHQDNLQMTEDTDFSDIGGLQWAKLRLQELILLPFKHPEVFLALGIKRSKGILLSGPPGCGKTLLARAIAQKLGASFFLINGPEFFSKFYGDTEEHLRNVFTQAYHKAPSVIFMDEIDAIASSRNLSVQGLEVRVVSQLLTLLDGLDERDDIVVIGATNRINAIDTALRRPGRFDNEIEVLPPDTHEREEILRIHTRNMPLASNISLAKIAEQTVGFVGADLANLCQEAAIATVRRLYAFNNGNVVKKSQEALVINENDFRHALTLIQPSAFRTLEYPQAQMEWDEIPFYHQFKTDLIKLIQWQLNFSQELQDLVLKPVNLFNVVGCRKSGKTTLITALAKKLNLSLLYLPASDLLINHFQDNTSTLRDVFQKARLISPSMIVIDDFDSLISIDRETAFQVLVSIRQEITKVQQGTYCFTFLVMSDPEDVYKLQEESGISGKNLKIPDLTREEVEQFFIQKVGKQILENQNFVDWINKHQHSITVGNLIENYAELVRYTLVNGGKLEDIDWVNADISSFFVSD